MIQINGGNALSNDDRNVKKMLKSRHCCNNAKPYTGIYTRHITEWKPAIVQA